LGAKLLELQGITFGYHREPVLEEVNLTVEEKDFILLLGPNGGGKTTLFKIILEIVKPWQGNIFYSTDLRGRIGYVPQFVNFNRGFPITVAEAVLMGRLNRENYLKGYTKEDRDKTADILKLVGLYEKRKERIGDLSGGQLQRCLIARALVSDPVLLLLDEPTASIDIKSQMTLVDLLSELRDEMSIMLATHDPTPFSLSYKHVACINKRLYFHSAGELDGTVLERIYGCPVDLLGHGIPHTILKKH